MHMRFLLYHIGGLTVDRDNNKLYFSYKSGPNYYVAEKVIGDPTYFDILDLPTTDEFSAILVNGE